MIDIHSCVWNLLADGADKDEIISYLETCDFESEVNEIAEEYEEFCKEDEK